ncbi:amidase family protein [Rhodobacteraceae bacterium]|nr:amidase family protein [Paracoccaceae bacterium]
MQDWLTSRAADLGRGIEADRINPVALTETYLAAIETHPFANRIYVHVTPDRARSEAKAAAERAKTGQRLSLLDGVPISWKDLYDTAGDPTASGTLILKDRVPDRDALVVRNATAAGLVCLGKTHQTEFAFSGLGLNPMTESPPCVNNHDAASGGSSSGAGTSVAFGLAAAGIGSDTGGSVRIPSVWNDLVGLKTVSGRLSLEGVVPLCARFDTVGPLARSVEDSVHLLAALEGCAPLKLGQLSLEGANFAILRTAAFDGIEDVPRAAFENAVERLKANGVRFTDIELPEIDEAMSLSPVLFPAEAYGTWAAEIEAGEQMMYPPVRQRFLQGKTILAADFVAAWQRLDALRVIYREKTASFDTVVLPSAPIVPPKIADLLADEGYFTQRNLMALQNTRIANLMGLAALTLPTGTPSCGIMLQNMCEEDLLPLGLSVEAALA